MKLKNIWLLFGVFVLLLVPIKIYSSISAISFAESVGFFAIFIAAILVLGICMLYFVKIPIKNIEITKNWILGALGIAVALCFFWCIPAYFNDLTTKYDAEWQPLMMSVFSTLSFVSFILFAISHFMGKSVLTKVPFFIYCPVLWFCLKMILFLSMNTNVTDKYAVFSVGIFALFTIYYTQMFATSTKANNVKIMYFLGLSRTLFSLSSDVPTILSAFLNQTFVESQLASAVLGVLLTAYAVMLLVETQKQIDNSQVKVIDIK